MWQCKYTNTHTFICSRSLLSLYPGWRQNGGWGRGVDHEEGVCATLHLLDHSSATPENKQKVKCQTINSLATCQFSWNTCPWSLPANISGLIHIVIAWDWIWLKILKTTQVHWIDFLMKKTQFKLVFTSIWQCTDYNINNSLSFS